MKFFIYFIFTVYFSSAFSSGLEDKRKDCPELTGLYACVDTDKVSFDLTFTQRNLEGNGTEYVAYKMESKSLNLIDYYNTYEITYVGPGKNGMRLYTISGCAIDYDIGKAGNRPELLINEQVSGGRSTNVDAVIRSRNVFWMDGEELKWKREEARFDTGTAQAKLATCTKAP